MKKWNIGCSGFYNRHWKGVFYPEKLPQSKFFNYYSEHLNTVELNVTFYRFPTAETLQKWYDKSPDDYIFAVKAPKLITHMKKFDDCERLLNDFYTACKDGLKEKLGCVLFQLPPSFSYTEERLELLLKSMNPEFKNVIEFRNVSWWKKKIYERLEKENIIFCTVNHPTMPTDLIVNNETVYVRLHGNPKMFYSKYSAKEIKELYESINKKRKVKEVYVYFNNTASTAGIENATELVKLTHP